MWNKRHRIGIALAGDHLAISFVSSRGKRIHVHETPCQIDWKSADLSALPKALTATLNTFPSAIFRADNLVRLALPDPLFTQTKHAFEEFPKSAREAAQLVAWRHCEEMNFTEETRRVGYQVIDDPDPDRKIVIAQSCAAMLVDQLLTHLNNAGLKVAELESIGAYVTETAASAEHPEKTTLLLRGKGWWSLRFMSNADEHFPAFSTWSRSRDDTSIFSKRLTRLLTSSGTLPSTLTSYVCQENDLDLPDALTHIATTSLTTLSDVAEMISEATQ